MNGLVWSLHSSFLALDCTKEVVGAFFRSAAIWESFWTWVHLNCVFDNGQSLGISGKVSHALLRVPQWTILLYAGGKCHSCPVVVIIYPKARSLIGFVIDIVLQWFSTFFDLRQAPLIELEALFPNFLWIKWHPVKKTNVSIAVLASLGRGMAVGMEDSLGRGKPKPPLTYLVYLLNLPTPHLSSHPCTSGCPGTLI